MQEPPKPETDSMIRHLGRDSGIQAIRHSGRIPKILWSGREIHLLVTYCTPYMLTEYAIYTHKNLTFRVGIGFRFAWDLTSKP